MRIDRFLSPGETRIGSSFDRFGGGKGANQAMSAARLGARTSMVGRIGNDPFGDEQLANLGAANIDTSGIIRDPFAPTGTAAIMIDQTGQNQIVVIPGANYQCSVDDIEQAREHIAAADMLLLQLEIPIESTLRAIHVAAEVGTPVLLNLAPAASIDPAVLPHVSVLSLNETEVEEFTGLVASDQASASAAARRLHDAGVASVVITLGKSGALVFDRTLNDPVLVPSFSVQAVDTVGAGDTFNGALAVRLAEGAGLVDATRYANAAAAIAVTRHGAQPAMPFRDEVERFLAERGAGE